MSRLSPRRSSCVSRALPLALLLAPALAGATTNVVEFQLDGEALGGLVQETTRSPFFCPTAQACPLGGGQCILDRVSFPSPAALRRSPDTVSHQVRQGMAISAPSAQLVLPINLGYKSVACYQDPTCGLNTFQNNIQVTSILDLTVSGQDLCASIVDVEFLGQSAPAAVVSQLQDIVGSPCERIDLGALRPLFGDRHPRTGSGVTVSADETRLGVRFEFDTTNHSSLGNWQTFFGGTLAPTQGGSDWSLFIAQGLFRRAIADHFEDAILCDVEEATSSEPPSECSDQISHDWGPTTQWLPLGPGGAVMTVSFGVQVDTGICPNTIGIDPVTIAMPFTLNKGSLHTQASVSTDLVDSDVLLCLLAWSPLAGLATGGLELPFIIGGAIFAGTLSEEFDGLPAGCQSVDDEHFTCDFPINMPVLDLGAEARLALSTDSLLGLPQGLVVSGGSAVTPASPRAPLSVSGGGPHYGVHGGCSSLHAGYEGAVSFTGNGRICQGPLPGEAAVVAARIVDDPLGIFHLEDKDASPWLPENYTIKFPWFISPQALSNYWANPYPLRIRVATTAGSRTVEYPAPAPVSAEQAFDTGVDMVNAKVDCMARQTGWLGIPGLFDPSWHVDPPYDLVAQLLDPTGRPLPGVSVAGLANVRFEIGARVSSVPETFTNRVVPVTLIADAVVYSETLGLFVSPIRVTQSMDITGRRLDRAGNVELSFTRDFAAPAALSELPRGVVRGQVQVALPRAGFTLRGQFLR